MSRIFLTLPLLTFVAATDADITAGHYWWSAGTLSDGRAHESFRLFVETGDGEPWSVAGLELGPRVKSS